MLKYTPEQFRSMSLGEFMMAMDGQAMANGTYKRGMSWNEVLEMEASLKNGKNPNR